MGRIYILPGQMDKVKSRLYEFSTGTTNKDMPLTQHFIGYQRMYDKLLIYEDLSLTSGLWSCCNLLPSLLQQI